MRTIRERFFNKVEKTEICWNWTACRSNKGYGQIRINGRTANAHRVSWELHSGTIPEGKQINHTCNNRSCVNPDHLYAGTQLENMYDRIKDGSYGNGERNPRAKLTEENVGTIRWLISLWVRYKDMSIIYGIDVSSVGDIKRGRTWSHV